MPEQIYPLDVNVAALLRAELATLDAGAEWRITRLAEQAQAAGYHAGVIRGRVDGQHRADADRGADSPCTCLDCPHHGVGAPDSSWDEAAPPKAGIALADELWPPKPPEERDLPYYEDVRDLLDAMLGTQRAEEVADMLTAATLLARRPAVDRGVSNACGCPGSGTHAHVRGCRLHPDGPTP